MKQRLWKGALATLAVIAAGMAGYYSQTGSKGTAPVDGTAPPIWLASGYTIRQVADKLTAPVGAAVGARGEIYVAESGWRTGTPPRVLRLVPGRERSTVAADFQAPLTGLTLHQGKLYVAYSGGVDVLDPANGVHTPLLKQLPAGGDHPNHAVTFGNDGFLYFGIGTVTNAGVVGEDNVRAGWVLPDAPVHDIPCKQITVRGSNFTIPNPLTPDPNDMATTGAFSPFGKTTARLQAIPGAVPCTGAVLRAKADGTGLEAVAWGLRNPVGVAFGPDGLLYATMQGYEDRGSRPIVNDTDYLYRIEPDRWYGWPDFAGGRSVTEEDFQKPSFPVTPLLADPPEQPPSPVATFPTGSGASGLIFPAEPFGLRGDALVALGTGIVRVNPRSGQVIPFARNAGSLPASGMARPLAFAADPVGSILVIDYGEIRLSEKGPEPVPGTGRVWRIARAGGTGRDKK